MRKSSCYHKRSIHVDPSASHIVRCAAFQRLSSSVATNTRHVNTSWIVRRACCTVFARVYAKVLVLSQAEYTRGSVCRSHRSLCLSAWSSNMEPDEERFFLIVCVGIYIVLHHHQLLLHNIQKYRGRGRGHRRWWIRPVNRQREQQDPVKKRKRDCEKTNDVLSQSSKDVACLAASLGAALERFGPSQPVQPAPHPGGSNMSSDIEAMLGFVAVALNRVSEEERLSCVMDMVAVVKDYTKKHSGDYESETRDT